MSNFGSLKLASQCSLLTIGPSGTPWSGFLKTCRVWQCAVNHSYIKNALVLPDRLICELVCLFELVALTLVVTEEAVGLLELGLRLLLLDRRLLKCLLLLIDPGGVLLECS